MAYQSLNPRRTRVFNMVDFSGGLNLVSDTFRLGQNESPDMLNVDVDRRGGFQVRRGVRPYSTTALTADPKSLWLYTDGGGVRRVMAQVGSKVMTSTGSTWTEVGTNAASSTFTTRGVTFKYRNSSGVSTICTYWPRATASTYRWDGSTATSLGATFNNDLENPNANDFPFCKYVAVHNGYMWCAGTQESGTSYPNRVRFSHFNTAEDWRQNDYIDIDDGKNGDVITAIVPFRDHLIVFKQSSMYAIYGYGADTFSVTNISNSHGAVSQFATVAAPSGLYFFDHDTGLNCWDGHQLRPMFNQIFPALRDGSIPITNVGNTHIGWVNNRVWVSVPWTGVNAPRGMTFVCDPSMGSGVWTKYDLQAGPFMFDVRVDEFAGVLNGTKRVYTFDTYGQYFDDIDGTSANYQTINAYYRTRWIDLGQPAVKKRWRRMNAVLQIDVPYKLPVSVYADYDPTIEAKPSFSLPTAPSGDSITTPQAVWDSSTWDNASWYKAGTYGQVERSSSLGIAKAVSVKVGGRIVTADGSGGPVYWGVDALNFKYIPRRVR